MATVLDLYRLPAVRDKGVLDTAARPHRDLRWDLRTLRARQAA